MEDLVKKLLMMKELATQASQNLESLSTPKVSPTKNPDAVDAAKPIKPAAQESKKDPKKMAEQLKNPEVKQLAMDGIKNKTNLLKFNELGQWSFKD